MTRRMLWVGGLLAALNLISGCGDGPHGTGSSAERPSPSPHVRFCKNRRIEEISRAAREDKSEVSRGEPSREPGVGGRLRREILSLEGTALQSPADADSLSDLAAAYLTRGQIEEQPFDYVLALDAADRALAVQNDRAEALFNRAEALTNLQLTHQASTAWDAYLSVDSDSGWANDARRHLDELDEPPLDQIWEQELPRLQSALARNNSKAVTEIVSRLPHHARRWVEEKLLPAWGRGEPLLKGVDSLTAARQIGAVLQQSAGDALVGDTVTAIARAQAAGDSTRLEALSQGHRLYSEGLELYRNQDLGGARPLLSTARTALAAGGSPAVHWTNLYVAIIDFYRAPDEALPPLRRLAGPEIASRYPAVAGTAEWMLGILAVNRNQPEEGLHWFRSSWSRLEESYGPQASANLHNQIAIAYQDLGQPDRAWEERLAGLAALRRTGDRRRLHTALYDMADDLLGEERGRPALAIADEVLDNALAWGNANALAESRLQRGRAFALLGRPSEALDELRAGRDEARKIPSRDIGERVLAGLDLAESNLLAERDPREALRLLDRALATHLEKGFQHRIASLLVSRARAYRKLGDRAREEADLRMAIEEHEKVREGIQDPVFRLSSFEQAQAAFDGMVRLQIESHSNIREALSFAERARSRLLLDLISGAPVEASAGEHSPRLPQALPADQIVVRLPPGMTLIEYMVLPDRLLAWVVQRGSIQLVLIPISETELARAVAALRSEIGRRASIQKIQKASATLYRALIGPLAQRVPAGGPLVFVPDRMLVQVPFAALFDADHKRYLVEDHTIALAPSATLYLAALDRRSRMTPAPGDVLVVGDPAFDRDANPRLDRLDAAAAEGAEIADLYQKPDLLRDQEATRSAFLARAPGYRIVHFAGHALLHPTSPQLSRLLFAAEPGDSGSLYARDLAGYRLDGTELVVLSACRTLGGGEARESLVGLTAAFLAAGPPVVVSSLWKVEDQATRQLMLAFHRALRRGSDPAVALRAAQRQLLAEPEGRFQSPNFWAPFEVFGGAPAGEI